MPVAERKRLRGRREVATGRSAPRMGLSGTRTRQYLRDGRAPIPESETTSRVMSANRSRNTSPEVRLRSQLYRDGVRGYRLHIRGLPGSPDIAFSRFRVAVFVNGCFWHRCPYCRPGEPKSHVRFWKSKFRTNVARDLLKTRELESRGWRVLTLWECQIRSDVTRAAGSIELTLRVPEPS
jgi:DNA mismatch endonuclease, patch repair protein